MGTTCVLDWTPVAEAIGYRVYQRNGTLIAQVAEPPTAIRHRPGRRQYYLVEFSANGESPPVWFETK